MKTEMNSGSFSPERRDLLVGAGALGVGALAATLSGSSAFAAEHEHMHGAHTGSQHDMMIKALHECMRAGDDCLQHCLVEFSKGDTEMANCARLVIEAGAFCSAHAKLATMNAANMKELCELNIKYCAACEKECRKFEKKHSTCKACAEACAACIKECKAFLKA